MNIINLSSQLYSAPACRFYPGPKYSHVRTVRYWLRAKLPIPYQNEHNSEPCLKPNIRLWYLWQQLKITCSKIKPLIRVFAKAEFTNPIPQKIHRTKKYCGIPQNKGHEFHNIFKFCGTTPQIIPNHIFFRPVKYFVENRFRFRKSTTTTDSTNKIRTFLVKFRFVNSAFADTLFTVIFFI